jgi:hypothetical protein
MLKAFEEFNGRKVQFNNNNNQRLFADIWKFNNKK